MLWHFESVNGSCESLSLPKHAMRKRSNRYHQQVRLANSTACVGSSQCLGKLDVLVSLHHHMLIHQQQQKNIDASGSGSKGAKKGSGGSQSSSLLLSSSGPGVLGAPISAYWTQFKGQLLSNVQSYEVWERFKSNREEFKVRTKYLSGRLFVWFFLLLRATDDRIVVEKVQNMLTNTFVFMVCR